MTDNLYYQVATVLNNTQISSSTHQKSLQLMKKLYDKSDSTEFVEAFKRCLQQLLKRPHNSNDTFSERSVEFAASFCASVASAAGPDESFTESQFLIDVFNFLLKTQDLDDANIRYRSCQMLNKLLDNLKGGNLSLEICKDIENAMLDRLNDFKTIIRLQAVIALHCLQDVSNPDDPIIEAFVTHMLSDSNAKVRKACVEKVAPRRDVVVVLMLKVRDVDVNVRLAAYKRAAKHPNNFKIVEKHVLIKGGFSDDSQLVNKFVSHTLLPAWLEHYEGNFLLLLKAVRLDADEKDIEETTVVVNYILQALFKQRPHREILEVLEYNDERLLPYDALNWETAIYWRCFIEFLRQSSEYEHTLEEVLPDVINICSYIQGYYKSLEHGILENLEYQFILKQMFLVLKGCDCTDGASQKSLNELVVHMLMKADLARDVIFVIIESLQNSIVDVNKCNRFVCELISEIMYPMDAKESSDEYQEKQFEMAKLRVQLNGIKEDQETAISEKDFMRANQLESQIKEVKGNLLIVGQAMSTDVTEFKTTDAATVAKCLQIAIAHLSSPKVTHLCPMLQTLKANIVDGLLIHPDQCIRTIALKCYGLFCLVDKKSAETGIHILSIPILSYQSGSECDVETLLIAISNVVQLLMIFGTCLVASPEAQDLSESCGEQELSVFAGGTSLTNIIQGLVDLMNDRAIEVQERAVHGLCDLIMSGRVHSCALMSRMIIKWCNPAADDDDDELERDTGRIRQTIGSMLNALPHLAHMQELLEKAVIPTLTILFKAPKHSPLSTVNADSVTKFMLELCRSCKDGHRIHYHLALSICNEIAWNEKWKFKAEFSKVLLMLNLCQSSDSDIDALLEICHEIRDNANCWFANTIVKFMAKLSSFKNGGCAADALQEPKTETIE